MNGEMRNAQCSFSFLLGCVADLRRTGGRQCARPFKLALLTGLTRGVVDAADLDVGGRCL